MLAAYAIPILTAILSIFWYLLKRVQRRPPLPPGPRGLPIVGNLPFLDPDLHTYFTSLAQTHGSIFKLNLGSKLTVVISSPSLAREILKDQDINFANHDVPLTGRAATYGGLDILWSPYGAEWRMLRKVCLLKLLSRKTLDSFYELRRKEIRERTRFLYKQSRGEAPVNVGDQLFLTMMNLTMNMLWGGSVKAEEMASVGTEFKGVISEITRLIGEPNVSDFFPWLARFDIQGLVKSMRVSARQLDAVFDRAIKQMQQITSSDGECKDFLQYLMKLKDQESDSEVPITLNHVKAVLTDMVVGGTDTSMNTVEFAMAELINKPELMKKAQQELDQVVGKDNIVEESHITKLPYIVAIMKETLRLHPTLPLLVPRRPAEAAVVGGYTIPKDTKIFINVWCIQRDPNVWEKPTEFRPERFLDNNKPRDFTGTDYSYFPFGSGRRICAGVALAERMVLYTLATLLHSFDWKIPQGHVLDLEEKIGIVLKLKTPLVALPVPRLSDSNLYI
uniref:Putative cytochrome P450 n=1 Tax=Matthiola incana TaxID=3724 RepID=Q9FPN1_MATIN|nr:putative cytochrome P450 [Matthiola incana]